MAAAGGGGGGASVFTDEELGEIAGLKRGEDHIEVTCGCTSRRYGDAVGRLQVFVSGDLQIACECTPGCPEGKLTPVEFEKHSGRETARRWKSNIWVIVEGVKVSLAKTALLKYHNQAMKVKPGSGTHKGGGGGGRRAHRDEFVRCASCGKDRRFRLRTAEECRAHHDARADPHWKCSDMPFDRVSCEDEEERASRKIYRGCGRSPLCSGCTSCVCFGCPLCRFPDCPCRLCVDFHDNA
ncbi:protein ULTRAPETALA 1-like [Wolffia australiana]